MLKRIMNLCLLLLIKAVFAGIALAQTTVTFQCNMNIQIQSGNFDPANDQLVLRGSFNSWAGNDYELTDDDADSSYTVEVSFPGVSDGTVIEFKFVIVPATGDDRWEIIDNRTLTLESSGAFLFAAHFDNQNEPAVTAGIIFQADLSELLDQGWFDPAEDSIRVVGSMNNWVNDESMAVDPFDPSLYIYRQEITAAPGTEIRWKYRAFPADKFLDSGWETGEDHQFEFTGVEQTLEPRQPKILPAGGPLAQDVTVRFQVDVNLAVDWYNRQPFGEIESVWLTGDWHNWGGSWNVADTVALIRLYDDGFTYHDSTAGDGIWTAEVIFEAGDPSIHLYKYSIYAAGVDTLNNGSDPLDNEAGFTMNHALVINDRQPNYILPVDFFGSQWRDLSNPTVTFQCDMRVQIQSGRFDPHQDKLVVRGSFNGWAGAEDELTDADGDQIYTLTTEFPDSLVQSTIEYKFVIIPAEGSDLWENVDNRNFVLAGGRQVLEPVYFNNQEIFAVTATVTFQANMIEMLDKGWFDPAEDSMRVVGGMNGWANEESMQPDLLDPALYLFDLAVTAAPGEEIEWKFRGFPNDHFLDGGWESGENHRFTFSGDDLLLDAIQPNILPGGSPLVQDVTVRFQVDVNEAKDWYNRQSFQPIQSVWVTGDWNSWGGSWSVADTSVLIRLYDDGFTMNDATAGDGLWTTEVAFATGATSVKLYKYSIYAAGVDTLNGGESPMDNEAGFSMNHVLVIDDNQPLNVLPPDMFGSQWTAVQPVVTQKLPTHFEIEQNYPNPFNPITEIKYSLPKETPVKLVIYNTLGQRIISLVDEKQTPGTYRVVWQGCQPDGTPVASGIYFYYIEADGFREVRKMVLGK